MLSYNFVSEVLLKKIMLVDSMWFKNGVIII